MKKEAAARAIILNALDNKQAKLVLGCKTAFELWEKLETLHIRRSDATKVLLKEEFYNFRQKTSESIVEYLSRIELLQSRIEDFKIEVTELDIIQNVVFGLNSNFRDFKARCLEQDPSRQTMHNLVQRLLSQEQVDKAAEDLESMAIFAKAKDEEKVKKSKNNRRYKGQDKKNKDGKTKEPCQCWICQGFGHWRKDCLKGQDKKDEEIDDSVMAIVAECHNSTRFNGWWLDSGCTDHMTNEDMNFESFKSLNQPLKVNYGESFGQATKIGSLKAKSKTRTLNIQNVLYVPNLRRKLISLAVLTEKGIVASFKGNSAVLYDKTGEILLTATKEGMLYKVDIEELSAEANACISLDNIKVWNERFGHLNKQSIVKMAKNQLVEGLESCPKGLPKDKTERKKISCVSCSLGKQH